MFGRKLMSKILLDTNLLIYSIDQDSKYFNSTTEFLADKSLQFYTTSKNLSVFLAVTTRLPNSALKMDDALVIVEDFKSIINIIYPADESYSIFIQLLQKYKPVGLKIHDFEIASIALANKINTIATFNKKDFVEIKELEILQID